METEKKPVMIVGIDNSDHSFYALEWTLDHFFVPSSRFKLIIIHSKPSYISAVGYVSPDVADVIMAVETDSRKNAARVVEKAKELCNSKSVDDVKVDVVIGDARNVLCEAVKEHNAAMLVVGSHGYGAIKRAVLGSVSDYVSHHANCTVMIVKKPKIKR